MNFYVISEENYISSSWYKSIIYSLSNLQKRKRLNITFLSNISELREFSICNDDILIIIGSASLWLDDIISAAPPSFGNKIIVLADYKHRIPNRKYSIITIDISQNIACLYSYLNMHNKKRIALYGINPNSTSDLLKKESFIQCGGQETDCFYNEFSLKQCYQSFSEKTLYYDGVICVNDYAAISLIKHIGTKCGLFITSFGDTLLAKLFSPSITSTRTNFRKFGNCIYDLVRFLQKNSSISSLSVYLDYSFIIGETTDYLPFFQHTDTISTVSTTFAPKRYDNAFYSDSEIREMSKIEKMLTTCDDFDILLITQLLNGTSLNKIAENLFISLSSIKYKLKQLYSICEVQSKSNFVNLLNKYIDIETFTNSHNKE